MKYIIEFTIQHLINTLSDQLIYLGLLMNTVERGLQSALDDFLLT
jgi:hypothetical protein